jgi:hypothetical protein
MMRRTRILSVGMLALVTLLVTASNLWAIPFSDRKIIIEVNATAGDGGIQIFVDAEGWNRLQIADPNRTVIFEVTGSGSVGVTGVTELFFESAEPSFEDLPLDQLLARFPAGNYTFSGTTVDGRQLSGKATLKHNIPAGPIVVSPEEGESVDPQSPVVIDWEPVTEPFPGTDLPVTITGYQVIVERVRPAPLLVFSVFLPATVTSVTVPPEFLEAGADYIFEVLAIEASGNQTITESSFETTAGRVARSVPLGGYLQENRPNPFNPSTAFGFVLPTGGFAELRVIDVQGRVVRTLVSGELPAGNHNATWDGTDESGRAVASGVYIAALSGPGVSESRRVVLTR